MSQTNWPWAIILCKFSDLASVPQQPQFYQDFYTKNGTGGACDYWREVSFGNLDLTQSQVFGWFTMNHSSSELSNLHFPGDRWQLVQWGINTAQANGVNLSSFKSILVVQNWGVDHGFAGNGVVIVHKYTFPTLIEYGFICHEMGHSFGFPHSWSANPDTEYGDGWDIMSWDTATSSTSDYSISFESASGTAGPGLNARNVEALGAVPPGGTWTASQPYSKGPAATFTLHALNQPYGGSGYVVAEIPPNATTPPRASNSRFTVEFRHKGGLDQGIPTDTVLIHEIRTDGLSYLQPSWGGQFVAGQQFVTPDPKVLVQVKSIDPSSATATVQITVDSAAFVSQTSIARIDCDREVKVTMTNTGNTTWKTADSYRLGSQNPQDNTTWSLSRVDLPNDVPPGQSVTFDFWISPTLPPGHTYNYQWRMVRDGVAWFGDFTPNQKIAVYPCHK